MVTVTDVHIHQSRLPVPHCCQMEIIHVSYKHSNHPDELYKQCNHGVLEPRKWINVGKNGCFNPESCCWGGMQEATC